MPRISYSKSKNVTTYYIIEDYYRNGKRTTRVIDTIGNYNKIFALASEEGINVDTWLKNYLNKFLKIFGLRLKS